MFSSTVMLGNRLNCWKTIPIRVVMARVVFDGNSTRLPFFSVCVRGLPSTKIKPPVSSSKVMTRRRIVVLPEPLGPMSVTRSPGATVKLRSLRTVVFPNRFSTSLNSIAGVPEVEVVPGADEVFSVGGKALLHSLDEQGCRVAGGEEDETGQSKGFRVGEFRRSELLC